MVRFESVMKMRNALEELGKMEGITEKEKGEIVVWIICCVFIKTPYYRS